MAGPFVIWKYTTKGSWADTFRWYCIGAVLRIEYWESGFLGWLYDSMMTPYAQASGRKRKSLTSPAPMWVRSGRSYLQDGLMAWSFLPRSTKSDLPGTSKRPTVSNIVAIRSSLRDSYLILISETCYCLNKNPSNKEFWVGIRFVSDGDAKKRWSHGGA